MQKKAKYNIDLVKFFMTNGAKQFYLGYYKYGKQLVKDTYIDKEEIEQVLNTTINAKADFEKGSISKNELIEKTIKSIVLKNIIEFEYEEKRPISLKIYKYMADCIVGNIYSMFRMVANVKEFKDVKDETIKEAKEIVYKNIAEMFLHSNIADEIFQLIK